MAPIQDNDDDSFESENFDDTEQPEGDVEGNNINKEEKLELAKKEDKWVVCLRISTAVLLLLVAAIVCVGVYWEETTTKEKYVFSFSRFR